MRRYQVPALLCLDFTGLKQMQRRLSSASSPLVCRLFLQRPCRGPSIGNGCSQSDLAGRYVRSIVRSSCNRRCTGRSTNGRSRDFESLCLGSNPSRPTTKSTPDANRKKLGLFRGSKLPQRYDVLDSARNGAEKEVRSLK